MGRVVQYTAHDGTLYGSEAEATEHNKRADFELAGALLLQDGWENANEQPQARDAFIRVAARLKAMIPPEQRRTRARSVKTTGGNKPSLPLNKLFDDGLSKPEPVGEASEAIKAEAPENPFPVWGPEVDNLEAEDAAEAAQADQGKKHKRHKQAA